MFSPYLLRGKLASIPDNLHDLLLLRVNEPNIIQLLKLAIRAFFNNILRAPYMETNTSPCVILQALWLTLNMQASSRLYSQYHFVDLYPYVDFEVQDFIEPFPTSQFRENDVAFETQALNTYLEYLITAAVNIDKATKFPMGDYLFSLEKLISEEKNLPKRFDHNARTLMRKIGERHGKFEFLLNMFMKDVIDKNNNNEENNIDIDDLKLDDIKNNTDYDLFSDKSICLLSRSRDGEQIITILPNAGRATGGGGNYTNNPQSG